MNDALQKAVQEKRAGLLARTFFRIELTPTQERIVKTIAWEEHRRISISAMTRYGKTKCVAIAVALYIMMHPGRKISFIGPQQEQAELLRNYMSELIIECPPLLAIANLEAEGADRLMKEASKKRMTFKNGCEYRIYSAKGEAERLMGHGGDLIIVDEACMVGNEAYTKILRMLGDNPEKSTLVELYNPWSRSGKAYEHTMDPAYLVLRVGWETAVEEGRTTKEFIEEQRKEITPLEFTVLYESQFPTEGNDSVFSLQKIQEAIKSKIDLQSELDSAARILQNPAKVSEGKYNQAKKQAESITRRISCDVADMGLDETVIDTGLKRASIWQQTACRGIAKGDPMSTVSEIMKEVRKPTSAGKTEVLVDCIGIGSGVVSRLKEAIQEEGLKNTTVIPCHFGAKAHDAERYLNKKAEQYMHLRKMLEDGQVRLLDHGRQTQQMMGMQWELSSSGKAKIVNNDQVHDDWPDALVYLTWGDQDRMAFTFL